MGWVEEVRRDRPLGWWRLGETSGTSAADTAGFIGAGTYTGGYTLNQTGALIDDADPAVLLNGTTGYVALPGLTVNGDCTFEFWFKAAAFGNVLVGQSGAGSSGYILVNAATVDVQFGGTLSFAVPTVTAGGFYHLAVTRRNGSVRVFLNGVESSSGAQTDASTHVFDQLGRYKSGGSGAFWSGVLDDVVYYAAALPGDRIIAHYTEGRVRGFIDEALRDSPKILWMGRLSGTIAADESPNHRNLAAAGSPATVSGLIAADVRTTLTFDASNDDLSVAYDAALAPGTGDFTVEAFVKSSYGDGDYQGWYGRDVTNTGNGILVYSAISTGVLRTWVAGNVLNSGPTLTDGVTHHIVLTRISGVVYQYVDGVQVGSFASSGNANGSGSPTIWVGRTDSLGTGSQRWNGPVQGFGYYLTGLAEARVRTHYAARLISPLGSRIFA